NFRAKPDTPMKNAPEPSRADLLRTIAVARLVMPNVNIQAPPNLSDPDYEELLDAGINDWGGISPLTPDFINPHRPCPPLTELDRRTRAKGFELRRRLPVYPEFISGLLDALPAVALSNSTAESQLLKSRLGDALGPRGYARSAA